MSVKATTPASEIGTTVPSPFQYVTTAALADITTTFIPSPAATATATATTSTENIRIEIPPATSHADEDLIATLIHLVNSVYGESEETVYQPGFKRTAPEDIRAYLRAGQLAIALATFPHTPGRAAAAAVPATAPGVAPASTFAASNTTDRPITAATPDTLQPSQPTGLFTAPSLVAVVAGCVLVRQVSSTTGDIAMLAVAQPWRGTGLGARLMGFAEARCARDLGLAIARLEVLVPTHFEHEGKARLQAWYARRGYVATTLRDFADAYPHLSVLLTGPTEYRVFEKALTT